MILRRWSHSMLSIWWDSQWVWKDEDNYSSFLPPSLALHRNLIRAAPKEFPRKKRAWRAYFLLQRRHLRWIEFGRTGFTSWPICIGYRLIDWKFASKGRWWNGSINISKPIERIKLIGTIMEINGWCAIRPGLPFFGGFEMDQFARMLACKNHPLICID